MRGCVPLLGMSPPRRYLPPAVLAITLIVAPLSACSSSPKPQPTASAYLADWGRQDWTAMRALTDRPPADFTSVNQAAFSTLSVRQASITAGTMATNGTAASEPITERLTLTGLGAITFSATLHLVQQQGKWLVQWSPATITPQLRPGDQLSLRVTWPARAPILGAGGTPLTTQGPVVTIGVEGARVKSAASLASALATAGATAQQASSAITAAKAHPTFFEPVFTVSRSRYNQLAPAIYPIPGTVFQSSTALTAATPGLTSGVVGTVGPVTAQELGQLGTPYSAQSVVGQTGLEQADERRLAGTPGATVAVVTKNGAQVATVTTLPAHPGTAVSTTIKESVQRAAEAALAGEKKSAALVALDASTGDVLAAVSVNAGGFDQAIDGGFPPGSTFKVITSTALINRGFGPQSAASCPSTATVDGEVFHNAESEAPVSTMLQAFTESCNTAFINLAAGHLTASAFPSTAAMFGLGKTLPIGLTAFGGSVPEPSDAADLAATSIGQGRVLVSPLGMAMVAAAADTGTVRAPRLVVGASGGPAAGSTGQLSAAVVRDLHEMMAVDSTGNGGPTCGPIVARFLTGLQGR